MTARTGLALVILLGPIAHPAVPPLFAQDSPAVASIPPFSREELRERVDRYVAEHEDSIQWDLPVAPREESRDIPFRFPFGELILWMLVGGAAIVFLVVLLRWLSDRRPPVVDDSLDLGTGTRVALSDKPLVAARAAAEAGNFEEAVHLLLLGTIEEIRTALDYDVPPWLTSREILRLAPVPTAGHAPLEGIIALVEASFFGTAKIDRAAWERAVAWHGELRAACTSGGAA